MILTISKHGESQKVGAKVQKQDEGLQAMLGMLGMGSSDADLDAKLKELRTRFREAVDRKKKKPLEEMTKAEPMEAAREASYAGPHT